MSHLCPDISTLAVMWDLGGVLVDVDLAPVAAKFRQDFDANLETAFFESGLKYLLDTGALDVVEICEALTRRVGKTVSVSAFADLWRLALSPRRPVFRVLCQLARNCRMGVISNTDPIHADAVQAWCEPQCSGEQMIQTWTFSFEVGCLKPEPAIYQRALRTLGVAPESAILIDDRPENVEAARSLGMLAVQYTSLEQVLAALSALGIRAVAAT